MQMFNLPEAYIEEHLRVPSIIGFLGRVAGVREIGIKKKRAQVSRVEIGCTGYYGIAD